MRMKDAEINREALALLEQLGVAMSADELERLAADLLAAKGRYAAGPKRAEALAVALRRMAIRVRSRDL